MGCWWGVWHARPSPKSQVEFGGGEGYDMTDHPLPPQGLTRKFSKSKSQVEFGGGGGGMACHTTPTTPKLSCLGVVGVVVLACEHHFNHSWDILHSRG